MKVGELLTQVRILIRDDEEPGGVQWLDDELLGYLNEACRETARIRPESSSTTGVLPLVNGVVQSLPQNGFFLLEVHSNSNEAGTVDGRAVRRVERSTLDVENPNWRTDTATAEVRRFVSNDADPTIFHVSPPNDGSGNLRATWAVVPVAVSQLTDDFPLRDIHSSPVINFVCYRAYDKAGEDPSLAEKSVMYYNRYLEQMGLTNQVMEVKSAKVRQPTQTARS